MPRGMLEARMKTDLGICSIGVVLLTAPLGVDDHTAHLHLIIGAGSCGLLGSRGGGWVCGGSGAVVLLRAGYRKQCNTKQHKSHHAPAARERLGVSL